jgi:hypothetical protein
MSARKLKLVSAARRRSNPSGECTMWKLITIAALAVSVMSAPALAQPRHHTEYQQYQSQGGGSAVIPSSNAYGPNY